MAAPCSRRQPVVWPCLRVCVCSDKSPATPVEIYDDKENEFTAECEHALREVFRRLDEDMDGLLNRYACHKERDRQDRS